MGQRELIAQEIDLPMMPGAGHSVVHFLKQHDIRLAVGQRLDDPFGAVQTVYAADALVNVVGYETELHGTPAL